MESCYRYRWRRVRWRRWVGLPAAVGGVCDDCVPARQPRSTARCSACTAAARGPSGMVVNCTVLSCPVDCTVLYCTVLRARRHPAAHRIWPSAVLYCTVLYCTVLCCTACTAASRGPSDMAVSCTVLYCTVLYCTLLYCVHGGIPRPIGYGRQLRSAAAIVHAGCTDHSVVVKPAH